MRALRVAILILVVAVEVFARVGGGESYSGSDSSSSSSSSSDSGSSGSSSYDSSSSDSSYGGGGGATIDAPDGCGFAFVVLFFIVLPGLAFVSARRLSPQLFHTSTAPRPAASDPIEHLRRFDPNFSRIVFEDFCYALYAHVHHARGAGDISRYAPYVSEEVRQGMVKHNLPGLKEVRGIVVGAMQVGGLEYQRDTSMVTVDVTYESNVTEIIDRGGSPHEGSWYVHETWTFERQRDILSPPPAKAKAEHCPRCGAALQTRSDGTCEYCSAKIVDGSFQWFVRRINVQAREFRGPLLTSNVPERGTEGPTLFQERLAGRAKKFEMSHPGFRWEDLLARVKEVAVKLNEAWAARDWERVRPLETEPLFQTHRYWIDAYIRQNLVNRVEDFAVHTVEPVKVEADAFYDAITVRLWASGRDYTVDARGEVVAGSRETTRRWSEYWTFIRTRGTQADAASTVSCPNCGASVVVGPTGICTFCNGKLTAGDFTWVLSRIEQDEAYSG